MRRFAGIVLLLVTYAVPGAAQSRSTAAQPAPKKPTTAACAELKRKQQQEEAKREREAKRKKNPDANGTETPDTIPPAMVSAPPSAAPTVSDPTAPGSVNVPVPGLPPPSAASSFGADANATDNSPLARACAELEGRDEGDDRLAALARKHPNIMRTVSRINTTEPGWTLRADSIIEGGGIAGGAAYRQQIADNGLSFDFLGMGSVRAYYLLQAGLSYPLPSDNRIVFIGRVRHESFPEEDFFGLGRDSLHADHTAYWRQAFDSTGVVTFSPIPTVRISGTAGVLDVRVLSGRQESVPTIQDRFTAADVPGLQMRTWSDFLHVGAGVDIDRTRNPEFPIGGRYRGSFTVYKAIDDAIGQFGRVDIDLREYVPLPRTDRHVIALRLLVASASPEGNAVIPFYFLPRIGGATTLRGFTTSRLTDRNALVTAAEYRWRMTDRIQAVALANLGDVAPSFSRLRPSKFQSSLGGGVRYRLAGAFLGALDVASSPDGARVVVSLGQSF